MDGIKKQLLGYVKYGINLLKKQVKGVTNGIFMFYITAIKFSSNWSIRVDYVDLV